MRLKSDINMASKLGVTALYVTPAQESGGPLTPGPSRIAATGYLSEARCRAVSTNGHTGNVPPDFFSI